MSKFPGDTDQRAWGAHRQHPALTERTWVPVFGATVRPGWQVDRKFAAQGKTFLKSSQDPWLRDGQKAGSGAGCWTEDRVLCFPHPRPVCHAHLLRLGCRDKQTGPVACGWRLAGGPWLSLSHPRSSPSPRPEGLQGGGAITGPPVCAHSRRTSRPSERQPFRAAQRL